MGRESTCWRENSVTLGLPERHAVPLGVHSLEVTPASPIASKFAPSGPSERPGRLTPPARAYSCLLHGGHGRRRVTGPGANERGGEA